ncbi:hypothetical protein [Corallococcus carmarthensis]|uniref:Lipoprotein n=1 Tax=Corallococcus carmarthensis TaxID=2316728 RepID=A0A3A8KHW8_9BACT|nr:hypothetical protein [Corallococcus carmarthensis]NOK19118.1 hypothetical protein [Corallococcus carmarthensis]RKH03791.1 hypothetical protein D7X32_12935 [Corallococcus carmarthensis]
MQMLKWWVGALALLALACGEVSEPSTPVVRDGEGLLELPLVSTSAGRSYKLVGATFAITGPQNATITDTSAESVSLALIAGTYSIQMNGDWHVERTDVPGVTVPVTLVSPNPMTFTLGEGESRPVRFLFKVPEDGTADVGIGVDSGGWISGTLQFEASPPPGSRPPSIFDGLNGKSIPFVISYESATVARSSGSYPKQVQVQTAPVTFQLGGAVPEEVMQQFVPALQGRSMEFSVSASGPGYSYAVHLFLENLENGVRLELHPRMIIGADAEGYPLLVPTSMQAGDASLSNGSGYATASLHDGTFAPR